MPESVSLAEAIEGLTDMGFSCVIEGKFVIVSLVSGEFPEGVRVLNLSLDQEGFEKGGDTGVIDVSLVVVHPAWQTLPESVMGYLKVLDRSGLRLVARRDTLDFESCIFLATDGFVGGESLGENGIPSLVLVFDESGRPKRWGVHINNQAQ